eukprot:CAMPEP_0202899450 /NCGR_PEP_ID=MMETSP1392-20130828/7674_1 /ASSEMBLY_ACC=CAM_ASM_000868 /TAXON_ID=225041 /ORGANISM="Chlamydomonas chlamydogama, Strain SAG 11-48b" /LENGTH=93 /DNA_ID=CAMNT_0049585629 /DNA_START=273 /DNA_END=554 /DNA_ORIENTATION=+
MPGLGENNVAENVDGPPSDKEQRIEVQPVRSILKLQKQQGEAGLNDSERMKRNISWQDFHGKELTMVHEFEPSESVYSDDEEIPQGKACCIIS